MRKSRRTIPDRSSITTQLLPPMNPSGTLPSGSIQPLLSYCCSDFDVSIGAYCYSRLTQSTSCVPCFLPLRHIRVLCVECDAERSCYPPHPVTGSICAAPPGFGPTAKPNVHIFVNDLRAGKGVQWQKHVTVESVALQSTTASFYAQHGAANVQLRPESPGSTSVWVRDPTVRLHVPQLAELLEVSVGLPVTRACTTKVPKSPTSSLRNQESWQSAQYIVSGAATDQEADAVLYAEVSDCLVKHGATSLRPQDRPVIVLVAPGDCNDPTVLPPTTYNYGRLVQLALCCNFSVQLWGFKFNFPSSLLALSAQPHVTVHWMDNHRERLTSHTKASTSITTTPANTDASRAGAVTPLSLSTEGVAIMTLDGSRQFTVCQKWVDFCKADLCDKAHFKCVHHRRDDTRFPHLDKPLCAFFLQGHCPKAHCTFAHPTIVGYLPAPSTGASTSSHSAISHNSNSGVVATHPTTGTAAIDCVSMRSDAPVFRRRAALGPVNVTTAEGWTSAADTRTHTCDSSVWRLGAGLGTTTRERTTADVDADCESSCSGLTEDARARVANLRPCTSVNAAMALAPIPTSVSSRFPPRSQWRQTSSA